MFRARWNFVQTKRSYMGSWSLGLADTVDLESWTFARVETIDDLYSSKIFGAKFDDRCDCGQLNGAECEGLCCQHCGVWVTRDSRKERFTRLGRFVLACELTDPWASVADLESLREFTWNFQI